ncbi:hypothetical protein ILYODFUR_033441 [Ilyodon furcidens]|uniref:Uncharacterized protein n=1 Tax=Ilyodon furcidens TaxID=33524 RepID=A0ABV0TQR4_9TELE
MGGAAASLADSAVAGEDAGLLAAVSLGDSAVADEDAGLLAAALTSAGRETTSLAAEPQEGAPRRRFLQREEVEDFTAGPECAARRRTALNRLTLHLLQQQWTG